MNCFCLVIIFYKQLICPLVAMVLLTPLIHCLSLYRVFNPFSGLDLLKVVNTSKAQAWQRSGRAGREAPGTCYRLFTESEYDQMRDNTLPEIQRYDDDADDDDDDKPLLTLDQCLFSVYFIIII